MSFPAEVTGSLDAARLAWDGSTLTYGEQSLPPASLVPDAPDVLPGKARGDYREKTVHQIIRDAVQPVGVELKEPDLIGREKGEFPDHPDVSPGLQPIFKMVLEDHFVVHTSQKSRFVFPFHALLPSQFDFSGRYKMYNGLILRFLATPGPNGEDFNLPVLEQFYNLFNGEEGLSGLDRQMLRLAKARSGVDDAKASADRLIEGTSPGPVFFAQGHQLVQRDLATVLSLGAFGRRDRVNATLTVLYFHIAIHYWRAAWCLEDQVQAFLAFLERPGASTRQALAAACDVDPKTCAFRGQLKFRIASSRERRISAGEGAATAHDEADERRLLRLPLNLALLGIARNLAGRDAPADFFTIADALEQDSKRAEFDALSRTLAWAHIDNAATERQDDLRRRVLNERTGFGALRYTIESLNRRELRRRGRDVTAAVMKRGGRGLVAVRGNVSFFELGQELLVLLTKLLAGAERLPYRQFLERLEDYGLAPQDRDEMEELADVMRSMQLLERHSDAGEAMYVSHFL